MFLNYCGLTTYPLLQETLNCDSQGERKINKREKGKEKEGIEQSNVTNSKLIKGI